MPKIQTSGYKKYWPLKAFEGRRPDGSKITSEVFRDMTTGDIHRPIDEDGKMAGWNGSPPELQPGEKIPERNNDLYKQNYDLIKWKKR